MVPSEPPSSRELVRSGGVRASEIVSDNLNCLIIATALSHGDTQVAEFRRRLGAPTRVLEARLDGLVGAGVMQLCSRPKSADGRGTEYVLTKSGRELRAVLRAIGAWDDRWIAAVDGAEVQAGLCQPGATAAADDMGREGPASPGPVTEISLLGPLAAHTDRDVVGGISRGGQRLLVLLALGVRPIARVAAAGTLWPEVSDRRAGSSLRSALARMDPVARTVIHATPTEIGLRDGVTVDLREARALAHRLVEHGRQRASGDLGLNAVSILSSDLLPDWYETWVVAEAEEWRQLRMSALEALASVLTEDRRFAEAAVAARAAMRADPFRESAHASLVAVLLAEGNQSEAIGVFERYRGLLRAELNMVPTRHLADLVRGVGCRLRSS